ncbi:hypothetical protein MPL3365_180220 [Mesorhizobium plurifarium]|uniref:Uncharacterized protein n=1 Tax=Mesorhizobium plurifarium TaxID=69974 RepID=A0A090G722_MESPL|nr:hypothetical protein MPL3365_180220 [Mesorhizobium plurifarium]
MYLLSDGDALATSLLRARIARLPRFAAGIHAMGTGIRDIPPGAARPDLSAIDRCGANCPACAIWALEQDRWRRKLD